MRTTTLAAPLMLASLLTLAGCAGSPAAPFNQLPNSQVTAYRLQNYEPPPAPVATGTSTGIPGIPGLPGLPPEIQGWLNQGAAGLGQLIPPGLIPPGLIPGMPTATAPAPAADQTPRFHGFRILSQTVVGDSTSKDSLAKVLGDSSNFDTSGSNCMYAEMGLSFSPTFGAPPDDVLISFSCRQTQSFNFAWPHGANTGMKSSTETKLADIVKRLWPAGT